MGIPEAEARNQDLIDAIVTSSQRIEENDRDGVMVKEQVLDTDSIYFKLAHVNSNNFGQAAYAVKELERVAHSAMNHMCIERANRIMNDMLEIGQSFRKAFDAKSSETIGINKQNSQTNVLGMIGKNKQERVYTMKDQAKSSLFDGILGRKAEQDSDED